MVAGVDSGVSAQKLTGVVELNVPTSIRPSIVRKWSSGGGDHIPRAVDSPRNVITPTDKRRDSPGPWSLDEHGRPSDAHGRPRSVVQEQTPPVPPHEKATAVLQSLTIAER